MAPEIDRRTPTPDPLQSDRTRVVVDADGSPRAAVLEAIERARGRGFTDIERSLYEAIEPRTVDRLAAADTNGRRTPSRVTFRYDGYTVTLRRDGDDIEVLVFP